MWKLFCLVLSGQCIQQVWYLITDSHLCVGLTHICGNAEDLSKYDADR